MSGPCSLHNEGSCSQNFLEYALTKVMKIVRWEFCSYFFLRFSYRYNYTERYRYKQTYKERERETERERERERERDGN